MESEWDGIANVRHGDLIIDRDEEAGTAQAWIIFQRTEGAIEFYMGLILLGPWQSISTRFYRTVVTLDDLSRYASTISEDATRRPIILSRISYGDVLWGPVDLDAFLEGDSETAWMPLAKFSFGRPAENNTAPIRWIRFSVFFPEPTPPLITTSQVPPRPADLQSIEAALFTDIANRFKEVIRVYPHLESNDANYTIRFLDAEGNEISHYSTVLSEDARAVLRDPLDRGLPYAPGNGIHLTWNPYSDVVYSEMSVSGKPLPLEFFQPYVVRSGNLFGLPLPETASEAAMMQVGEPVTIIIQHDESRCPMRGDVHDACWRVRFDGHIGPQMRKIEQQPLLSYMIVALVESPFLVDVETRSLHPTAVIFEIEKKDLSPPKNFLRNPLLRDALIRAGVKDIPPPPQTFEEGWQPDEELDSDNYDDERWKPDDDTVMSEDMEDLDSIWSDEGYQPDDW